MRGRRVCPRAPQRACALTQTHAQTHEPARASRPCMRGTQTPKGLVDSAVRNMRRKMVGEEVGGLLSVIKSARSIHDSGSTPMRGGRGAPDDGTPRLEAAPTADAGRALATRSGAAALVEAEVSVHVKRELDLQGKPCCLPARALCQH